MFEKIIDRDTAKLVGVIVATAPFVLIPGRALADQERSNHRWGDESSVCERSADRMLKACLFGLGEDQQTTLANCLNIADRAERRACVTGTRGARREEVQGCFAIHEARDDACELLQEDRYIDPLESNLINFVDPESITESNVNPYVSLIAGHTYVLRAGDDGEEVVVVHVTEESREILGAPCRIVKDVVFEQDESELELVEYTDDWFAQDDQSNVYYCGEIARNYEDGLLRNLDGSFEAGIDFAKAGELIRRWPAVFDAHRQEYALGKAEDIAQYVALNSSPTDEEGGENSAFECNDTCVKTFEFAPLEPQASEFKFYLPYTGFVLAVGMEDGEITGEREELVCVGDSLDVLSSCSFAEADEGTLREQLCQLDPETFCSTED